jgi:hypothetical protein
MRSKVWVAAAAGLGFLALGSPATAQIIATSIPREAPAGRGAAAAETRYAFHLFASPFAKWKYGEVYLGGGVAGAVQATPNSDFMLAGEGAFRLNDDFSFTAGGWYNKVGSTDFDFSGDVIAAPPLPFEGTIEGDVSLYEFHAGLFYRDFGIQGGIVKGSGSVGPNGTLTSVNRRAVSPPVAFSEPSNSAKTTDYDLFLVYKRSGGKKYPWAVSVGTGVYWKQGIQTATESPLRLPEDVTVATGFATFNVQLYKGLGIDASLWYIGGTDYAGLSTNQESPDAQGRFTIGIGYSFSR